VKNSSPWFESVGGAPPVSTKVIAVAILTVRSVSGKIGAVGAVICYFGSHLAMMVRAFYSGSLFFRGWGWQFIFGWAVMLENHLRPYSCYIYGLCILPTALSLFHHLLGIHEPGSGKKIGDSHFTKRSRQCARRIGAWLLLVPFVQVLLGALTGIVTLVLVLVLLAVHALIVCRRHSGILYLWMRAAVRIGMRDAVGRRSR